MVEVLEYEAPHLDACACHSGRLDLGLEDLEEDSAQVVHQQSEAVVGSGQVLLAVVGTDRAAQGEDTLEVEMRHMGLVVLAEQVAEVDRRLRTAVGSEANGHVRRLHEQARRLASERRLV